LVNDDKLDVKLADFGFSCVFDPKQGLDLGLGSPMFMAPELFSKQIYNEKVDIWSIGIIVYMLLSGCAPFDGKDQKEVKKKVLNNVVNLDTKFIKHISDDAKDFIKQALNKDFNKRLSAKQLLDHAWIKKKNTDNQQPVD
jgi:serine/threonine protein kinase